ncbi:RNA polymerase sigma factor [Verrucomicrobiota bacterium sgz303538]
MPNLLDTSDNDLVSAAQRGNWAAYAELVRRHQTAVRACLAVRLEQPHEAEDLAQEAFVTAFRKLGDFDAERPFGPWVRSIAFNLLRNHWRKFRVAGIGGDEELAAVVEQRIVLRPAGSEGPELAALRDCLDLLDGPARALVERRYADDASVREIAEEQGRKYSAVTMQLHRLRELLATCVQEKVGSQPA